MDHERLLQTLERIADALEKMADGNRSSPLPSQGTIQVAPLPRSEGEEAVSESTTQATGQENDINPILRFLTERNIQVKTFQAEEDGDGVLDNIAYYMGSRYDQIRKVYNVIKSKLNTGKGFKLDLKNASQEEIGYSCQLCNQLHQLAFLSDYKYFKSPSYTLTGKPNRIPTAINFFTGQWLERFIKTEVRQGVRQVAPTARFAYMANSQIILPNGDDSELDLLCAIDGEIFWFEAKTGDYQNHVDKYARMSRLLALDRQHTFMVLSEASDHNCNALAEVFGMAVANLSTFPATFRASISHLEP